MYDQYLSNPHHCRERESKLRLLYLTILFIFIGAITSFAQPVNDGQGSATDVNSLINGCSADAAYTTIAATADQSKGSCAANGPNYNVWFSFTATATTYMRVELKTGGSEGTLQYPFLTLWNSSLTQLSCATYSSQYSDIEVSYIGLTPGATYYVSVDNYTGAGYRGTFKLCLNDVVDYDYYQGATDVSSIINSCSADAAYTTLNASADQAKGSCAANGPNYNRWFKFTATATTYMKVELKTGGSEGTLQYPFLTLWNSSLTQLSCATYSSQYSDLEVSYTGLTPGATYYVSVDNYTGAGYRGTFKLCLNDAVDYDYYQGATDVSSIINSCSADAAYTTLNASADQAKGSCAANGPNYNRWFKFTATATTYMRVELKTGGSEGTLQYPFLTLWNSSLTQLSCATYSSQYSDLEVSYMGLTPGATYYVSVDNYTGAGYRGTFKLCLNDAVDYDFYQGATDVNSIINYCSSDAAYTTLNATADQAKGSCWANGPNYNRWFKFTATSTTFINVQLLTGGSEGTLQYPFLALWNSSLTQLACVQYSSQYSDIEVNYIGLTPGATYYISIDNYSGAGYRGTFKLCLSDVPTYDYYQGATTLSNLDNWCSADAAYTTVNASADQAKGSCWANGPSYNRWFKFQAIYSTATININTGAPEGTLQYPFAALWNSSLTQLACASYTSQYSDLTITYSSLTVGNWYYISVDNYTGAGYRGTFKLCINNTDPVKYYAIADGNWTTNSTWSNADGGAPAGSYPTTGKIVYIKGYNVTANSGNDCAALYMTIENNNTSLTVDGATLAISGKLTMTNSGQNLDGNIIIQNSGNLSVGNDAVFTRGGGANPFQLTMNSSTMSVGQDMSWVSTAGTVNTNDMILNNASSLTITRDLTMNYSGGMKINHIINDSGVLTIGRDITFTSTAAGFEELKLNNTAILNIARNFSRGATPYGTLTCNGSSTVIFNGTSYVQTFPASAGSGGDGLSFNNVTINNTNAGAPQVIMGGAASINGTLTLTNGRIQTTSSNVITLNSGASTSIGSSSSYIDGPVIYTVAASGNTTLNFPIGKSTSWRPATLIVNHSDATSVTYTAEVFNSSANALGYTLPGTVDKVSLAHYWQIDRQSVANFNNATVRLYYDSDDGVTDYTNLTVVKTIGAGTTWYDIGGTATANTTGNILSNSFTTFSKFTLGNLLGGTNPLPIELITFDAKLNNNKVDLLWVTASETNNDYFTIEKTKDGSLFEIVTIVDGAGNSTQSIYYNAIDPKPYSGISYYRLKQTDFDGKYAYSNLVAIENSQSDIFNVEVFPNPLTKGNTLNIFLSGNQDDEVLIVVTDLLGQEYYSKIVILSEGESVIGIDKFENLVPGMYNISATSNDKFYNRKIIIK